MNKSKKKIEAIGKKNTVPGAAAPGVVTKGSRWLKKYATRLTEKKSFSRGVINNH